MLTDEDITQYNYLTSVFANVLLNSIEQIQIIKYVVVKFKILESKVNQNYGIKHVIMFSGIKE